ncbi:hypothetical protein FB451DRAFT_1270929 [Mycena latifolia]|nr:hypothetical protein FB451DRAFT_1270929 [Mycena latifolia]
MSTTNSENPNSLIEASQLRHRTSSIPTLLELPREIQNDGNLPHLLDRLDLQRSNLDDEVTEGAALSTPIFLLPPELLCHIFLMSLPVQTAKSSIIPVLRPPTGYGGRGPWIPDSPWVFGQVCGQWRALALSLPNLWTQITLASRSTPRKIAMLETQLARSANAPLDVVIRVTGALRDYCFAPFLDTLVGQCARWRRVQLEFDSTLKFQLGALGPMPLLEELVVGTHVHLETYDFLEDARSLRKIVLSDGDASFIRYIPLPWAQLTSYKVVCADASIHFRNLAACASTLVECDIDFYYSQPLPRHGGTLTLPRLRRLTITHALFLDRLVAPALRDLYISRDTDGILPFLHNSGCILTRLTLAQCGTPAEDLLPVLRNTPSIATLRLDSCYDANSVISALTLRPDGACLCPNLASFSLANVALDPGGAAFGDMVESRWRVSDTHCRRLTSVAVYPNLMRLTVKGQRRLRRFAAEGMEVVVSCMDRKGWATVESWREW